MYDVIIIGGGPAGLTAGIYCLRANLKVLILERESIGGQISTSPKVENYPGFVSISGSELSNNLYEQVVNLNGEFEFESAKKIIPGTIFEVVTDYNSYKAKSVIIATGAHHRKLNVDGENRLSGNGVSYCASCDGAFYKDKVVAIVGGANTAVTNAIYLSNICKKVYLLCRKDALRADYKLVNKLQELSNVKALFNTTVKELHGENELESISVKTNDEEYKLGVDGLFVSIGMDPETEVIKDLTNLTSDNYIDSDDCKTKVKGIFVAGDARKKDFRQLTTAVSDGTIAANLAINYLSEESK